MLGWVFGKVIARLRYNFYSFQGISRILNIKTKALFGLADDQSTFGYGRALPKC